MAKSGKESLLEKIQEFIDAGYLIGELPADKKSQELKGLIAEIESSINGKDFKPIEIEKFFEIPEDEKSWYMKDEYFQQSLIGVKKTGDGSPPQEFNQPVNWRYFTFPGNNKQRFQKDIPLTNEQLKLFNEFQKNKYLEFR